MTTTTDDLDHHAPGAPAALRPAWYKRRGFLITASVIGVIGVSVLMDLPHHPSHAEQVSASQSLVKEVNGDVASCAYAVHEAFIIHGDQLAGSLSAANRARVPTLLHDDQSACSFTDSSINTLATIQPPASVARAELSSIAYSTTLWASSDADAAIIDIQTLYSTPGAQKIVTDLNKRERLLATDREIAMRARARAAQKLGATLPGLALPRLPVPPTPATGGA